MQDALLAVIVIAAVAPLAVASNAKETPQPYTSFQTPTPYRADHDIRTDAVIVYSDDAARIQSWRDKGYFVQTMYGFRTGPAYIKDHADEGQTDAHGTILTCGPGSYYMVPTENRIKAAVRYFTNAINGGAQAVCPEEPEFFQQAGYSESFKRAWQAYYSEPWQDPAGSIEARWKSERLKAHMEYSMVKAIMDSAAKQDPSVRRMVACHSAVSYYYWGIIYPHYECMMIPNLQEIIGQVWTGTARSACRYEGKMEERTFETAFLEYSSLADLTRGTGKRMWFLMDPLEDNPDRSMEDYHTNYEKTLIASLMFPEVDAYEVMPWPTRIYGRVPDEFATQIGSIINALQDMHNHPPSPLRRGAGGEVSPPRRGAGGEVHLDTGTQGIATFVADSMGWQRGSPHASNYDCFYGLTLPLIYKAVPIQVAQLERAPEKGYLDPYKVILMSYDIMKPMKPEYNQAIADWVKKGGVLVFFGGTDAYNALPEWWTKAGFDSPGADLYQRLAVRDEPPPAGGDATVREHRSGKGVLMHVGVSPSYFASSPEAADRLRAIAAHACKAAGLNYREQQHIAIRRGPYVAVRTFDGQKKLKGSYVNILDPKLPVVKDPVVPPQKCALYCDVTDQRIFPGMLLYSSSRGWSSQNKRHTHLELRGPLKTKGVARLFAGPAKMDSIKPQGVVVERSGDTVLLTYDNNPDGVTMDIEWEWR